LALVIKQIIQESSACATGFCTLPAHMSEPARKHSKPFSLPPHACLQIRINPGNFADGRKTFEEINYDDPAQFEAEKRDIEETFTPLVRLEMSW
jgi:hypothetical protein